MAVAFQCRNCGRLEEPDHAGDHEVPRGCRVCGKGVHFEIDDGGNPQAIDDTDNWTVLADLPDKAQKALLDKHALKDKDIVKHTPAPSGASRPPQHHERSAEDNLGTEDAAS